MGTYDKKKDHDVGAHIPQIAETILRVQEGVNEYLYHGKSPKYPEYFKKWAQRTMTEVNGVNHMDNLVNAMLSSIANQMVGDARTDAIHATQFYRGQICALKDLLNNIKMHCAEEQLLEELEEY